MAIMKAGKIISADIVHTDSGLLGGKPPEYYARADQAIMLWQMTRAYAINELCFKDGIIYRSKTNNNISVVTDAEAWQVYGGATPDPGGNDYEQLINYTMLYDQGDECTGVTGGWTEDYILTDSGYAKTPVTKLTNNLQVATPGGAAKWCAIGTNRLINLVGHTNVLFNVEIITKEINIYTAASKTISGNMIAKSCTASGVYVMQLTSNTYAGIYQCTPIPSNARLHHCALLKPDSWQPLCTKAGVTPPTTLDALLSDATAMTKIMTNADAINYMVKQCTGDFMVACCNSSTAMSALVNNIAYDKAFENKHWRKFMLMCPVSLAAMDSVAVTVPTMTSNTAPSGVASCSSVASTVPTAIASKVFDRDNVTEWISGVNQITNQWVGYEFPKAIRLYKVTFVHGGGAVYAPTAGPRNAKIQASIDGNTWIDLTALLEFTAAHLKEEKIIIGYSQQTAYKYFRLYVADNRGNNTICVAELQFYGKAVN